jgi:hypothetical protein
MARQAVLDYMLRTAQTDMDVCHYSAWYDNYARDLLLAFWEDTKEYNQRDVILHHMHPNTVIGFLNG